MHRTMRSYELLEPQTIGEAVSILSTYGNKAKVLAGGLDLVSKMRRWQIKPECVVSIRRIPGLDYIEVDGTNGVRIGALTSLRSLELAPAIQKSYTSLYEAVRLFASVQVKTMGTVVGNLCVATPASDIAPAMFVLGAELKVAGLDSAKTVRIENFYTGVGQTILEPNEIVIEIIIPAVPAGACGAFLKLGKTRADIAKINVAVMITAANGTCKEARIALGAVAPTVIRAVQAEATLKGQKLEQEIIREAAKTAAEEAKPITDLRSTAEYRKDMVAVMVRRAIDKALEGVKAQQ